MSSWLSLSLPNPFKSSDDQIPPPHHCPDDQNPHPTAGAKEDLSALGQTIGRQLRGVAAFLAPPPAPSPPHSSDAADDDESSSPSQAFLGVKNDLVEIGGSFKTSLSLLSSNKAVTKISRFASNLLQFRGEGDEVEGDEAAVGITDEVLEFAQEISLRPECWTDFPLSLHNDFDMSDVQREHAATVEHFVPGLEVLRHKICSSLSEEQFWMIYFILLLPRLNENDSKLLSTPEIIEVREILLQKLRNKKSTPVEISVDSETVNTFQEGGRKLNSTQGIKSPYRGEEEVPDHENTEQWLDGKDIDTSTSVYEAHNHPHHPENEDDVSFSDLEDGDNDLSGRSSGLSPEQSNKIPSRSESSEWVRLNESPGTLGGWQRGQSTSLEKDSEGEESNDWLTIDDVDLDSVAAA